MSQLSPQVQEFVKDLAGYFVDENRPFASAVQERLERCESDEEVERVAYGIIALLQESITVIRTATEVMTVENIHLFPEGGVSQSEDERLKVAIRDLA